MKKILILAAALLGFVGCTKSEVEELSMADKAPRLHGAFADETRTYLEREKYLRWHADDHISAFLGNTLNQEYDFDGETGANSGTFTRVAIQLGTGNPLTNIMAFYPYATTTTISEDGVVHYTLPATQHYAENSYGPGANPMVAATASLDDTFLYFRNVCGYLKLKFYGSNVTLTSVTVTGNNGEKLAGKATITAPYNADPTLTMAADATESVTIDCGEGVLLSADSADPTLFWVALPAVSFEQGLTITATDTNGHTFEKSTSKQIVIERNTAQPMAALEVPMIPAAGTDSTNPDVPTNTEIWYTTSDGASITPGGSAYYWGGVVIESNEYDEANQRWILKFDSEVTVVAASSFSGKSTLTSISLPNSVTRIGGSAFYNCSNLREIPLPDGLTTIGNNAFKESGLTHIDIPESVTLIGMWSGSELYSGVFAGCENLTEIKLPDSLTAIGDSMFSGCTNLATVTVGANVTSIGYGAFDKCSSLSDIVLPDALTQIGIYAFRDCSSLRTVTIGDGVTRIEDSAFADCSNLRSIKIGKGLTYIGYEVFNSCTRLTSVTIEGTITSYNDSSYCENIFYGCTNLMEFIGPNATEDHRCFVVNGRLLSFAPLGVLEYTIPAGITSIGGDAFCGISGLQQLTLSDEVESVGYNAFYGCSNLASVHLGNGLKEIAEGGFGACTSLTEITLPNTLETIGELAFTKCGLNSITLPDSVKEIGEEVFSYCQDMTDITFGKGLKSIGYKAFFNCSSLVNVHISDLAAWCDVDFYVQTIYNDQNLYTTPFDALRVTNLYLNGELITDLVIPEEVTTIKPLVFCAYKGLKSVTIHDKVTSIGYGAFSYTALKNVKIGNGVKSLGERAFEGCFDLVEVTCGNGLTSIEEYAFRECVALTSVSLPESLLTIGESAFSQCSALTEFTIPSGVEEIGQNAFQICQKLSAVYCKPMLPPIAGANLFLSTSSELQIYVPTNYVNFYKTASGWATYADKIVGYDF